MAPSPELSDRAKRLSVGILKFVKQLPRDTAANTVGKQLSRCASSVSANYRAAGFSRTRTEFVSRLGIVVEEADETRHWLQVLRDTAVSSPLKLDPLIAESSELRLIFRAALRTAKRNLAIQQERKEKAREERRRKKKEK